MAGYAEAAEGIQRLIAPTQWFARKSVRVPPLTAFRKPARAPGRSPRPRLLRFGPFGMVIG